MGGDTGKGWKVRQGLCGKPGLPLGSEGQAYRVLSRQSSLSLEMDLGHRKAEQVVKSGNS